MNALEFRLFLFKKQNYSYTFFSSNIPNSISSQDDIYLEVIDENKLVKVYCKDKNILNTCFQSAVSVVSYKPIIVKEIDASLVVGQSAEISSPVAKKLDSTIKSEVVSIPFVQLYTLDCAILDEIFVSKFNVNYHLEISGKGLVFADDCFQITPMTSNQSVNVSSTVTIEDITAIIRALNGTIISQVPTVSCDIDVANVKRINEEYTFKFTSKICPRVNVVRPVNLNQGIIVSDINAMSTLFISFPENIIGNQHEFLDALQANIINSSAASVIKLNPNNLDELNKMTLVLEDVNTFAKYINPKIIQQDHKFGGQLSDGLDIGKLISVFLKTNVIRTNCSLEVIGKVLLSGLLNTSIFKSDARPTVKIPTRIQPKVTTDYELGSILTTPKASVLTAKQSLIYKPALTLYINEFKDTFGGNINKDLNLSATVFIPEALYMKFKNPNGKLDLSINKARPMFLSDLENYKLNYIDHMYDEFYETEYTSLENLSYYIL